MPTSRRHILGHDETLADWRSAGAICAPPKHGFDPIASAVTFMRGLTLPGSDEQKKLSGR